MSAENPGLQRQLAALEPHQFKQGESGNPSGKPKGSHSVRAALKRRLRKGYAEDTDSDDGEQIGTWARQLADDIATAIEKGDADKVRAIATVIDQAEGKPQEKIEHSGSLKRVSIRLEDTPTDLEPL